MKTKTKTFDCIEMKRRGAEHVRRLTSGMTPEEELEFWHRETEELRKQQRERRAGGLAATHNLSGP